MHASPAFIGRKCGMNLPQRKRNRLRNFDYSSNGAYFVTICTAGRRKVLCDIVGDGVSVLSIRKQKPSEILLPNGILLGFDILFLDKTV